MELTTLIPLAQFTSHLEICKTALDQLEQDLPELLYYNFKSFSDPSGKAVRSILSAALDRANECRGNFVQSLIRINQMCLTLGVYWGIFPTIGTFDNGDFEHTITLPEMFPLGLDEKAQALQQMGVALPLQTALRLVGMSEDQINQALADQQAQDQRQISVDGQKNQNLANAMMNFDNGG